MAPTASVHQVATLKVLLAPAVSRTASLAPLTPVLPALLASTSLRAPAQDVPSIAWTVVRRPGANYAGGAMLELRANVCMLEQILRWQTLGKDY
jgi:hypothetical protein